MFPRVDEQTTLKFRKSQVGCCRHFCENSIMLRRLLKGSGSNSWGGRKCPDVAGVGWARREQRVSCSSHLWNGPKGGCWRTSWCLSNNAWDTLSLTSLTLGLGKGTALGSISPLWQYRLQMWSIKRLELRCQQRSNGMERRQRIQVGRLSVIKPDGYWPFSLLSRSR